MINGLNCLGEILGYTMEPKEKQPRLGRESALSECMWAEWLIAILLVAVWLAASAGGAPSPKFKLEIQYANGGTEMHLLGIGQPDTSGHPEVRVGTGPQGSWSEEHFVVTGFEVMSIRQHAVGL